MFRHISFAALEYSINRAYQSRLRQRGNNPEGVFWRSSSSQLARFETLLGITKELSPKIKTRIADIGCGYGAMLSFIEHSNYSDNILYEGVDINRDMVKACWSKFPDKRHLFRIGRNAQAEVDFSLFSGTFNLCLSNNIDAWEKYIFGNLESSWKKSRYGLVLNLLCDDKPNIRNQIYYANRRTFIARATKLFGPTHAISTPNVSSDVSFIINKQ